MRIDILRIAILLVFSGSAWSFDGGATRDALNRQAIAVRDPQRVVLLSAAKAGNRLVAVGERGVIILSDNEGQSWRQASVPVSVTLTAVQFVDEKQGFVTGHGGVVLSSRDGGAHWTKCLDGLGAGEIAVNDAQVSGDANALRNARALAVDGADKPFLDLHFLDAQRGMVVGAYNLAFFTEDGGVSWHSWMSRLDNPKGLHIYALRTLGDVILLVGEQGLVLRSNDAGKTFRRIETPYHGSYFSASLFDSQTMMVGGMKGNVWLSRDSGISWSRVAMPDPTSVLSSASFGEGNFMLTTQGGRIWAGAITGDAQEVTLLTATQISALNTSLLLDSKRVLVIGGQGATVLKIDASSHR